MTIQFNTDNHITAHENFSGPLMALISEELSKFSEHITRIEVHLADENGNKEGINDKRCILEARVEGRQPIAVTNHANTSEQAVSGAVEKLKSSLHTMFGRAGKHHVATDPE